MSTIPTRDRDADLLLLAEHYLRHLHPWCLPADWGVTYGRNADERWYFSAEEVLSIIGWDPAVDADGDAPDDWPPPEAAAYARELMLSLGTFFREGCVISRLDSGKL